MICRSEDNPYRPPESSPDALVRRAVYGRAFWFGYFSNLATMTAVAILFRYADFVTFLGGSEFHLGWIVGVGMIGSLLMRAFIGSSIDRYGPRLIWIGSLVLLAGSCFGNLPIGTHLGVPIYLMRIGFSCALAGVFGASMTFVASRVPAARVAEVLGILGTSGFVGILLGTQLGDWIMRTDADAFQRWQIDRMFWTAGLLGVAAIVLAVASTHGETRPPRRERPSLLELVRRYHPGPALVCGVAVGVGLGLPGVFLKTFVAELGIPGIAHFFTVYAATAIVARIFTSPWPERYGTTPMILLGFTLLAVSQLAFLLVTSKWLLVVPGVGYGVAHAILFPSVVAAGSRGFPADHRGLGTTLILAAWDLGVLVGAPIAGLIVEFSPRAGLPSYPTLFVTMAVAMGSVALFYRLARRHIRPPHPSLTPSREEPAEVAEQAKEAIES